MLSFMRAQTMLLLRSGLSTEKKRGQFGRTQRILWFAAKVNECSGFRKAGERPALKGCNKWRKLIGEVRIIYIQFHFKFLLRLRS